MSTEMILQKRLAVLSIFTWLFSVRGTQYGYSSLCHILPKSKIWKKNHGYELQSWIQSVIPYPSHHPDGLVYAGFISGEDFVKVSEVLSDDGITWKSYGTRRYDGWLYGKTDGNGHFRPGKTYYIFPDFKTAFVGTFAHDNSIMTRGVATNISHYRCNSGVMELQFTKPKLGSTIYRTILRNSTFASETPHERDPMGKKNVFIGSSINIPSIANQDALFARKTFAPHNLVAYYGGTWESYEEPYFQANMTPEERENKHKNLLTYNATHSIDITPEMSLLENYVSTLGHKANHDFINDNVNFCYSKHPVFGEIRCLESKTPINRGEEILINYGYEVEDEVTPQWYKDSYYYLFPDKRNVTKASLEE